MPLRHLRLVEPVVIIADDELEPERYEPFRGVVIGAAIMACWWAAVLSSLWWVRR